MLPTPVRPLAVAACLAFAGAVGAQCPEQPPLANYTGAGSVVCPCFIVGEEAGSVLHAPVGDYPIEILRVGIGWASQFGGAPQSLEQAIKIYPAGLPNPGAPVFTLPGPVMTDGFLNEFDLEPLPGEIVLNSGPFTVTLEFANQNAGDIFAPSVIHDGNGCQAGRNAVKAIPGGWSDACPLGVTGDWVFYAIYRQANCAVGVEQIVSSRPVALMRPRPNPFRERTRIEFLVDSPRTVDVSIFDVTGRRVATVFGGEASPGVHGIDWAGTDASGARVPAGVYFVRMMSGSFTATRKIVYVD